MLLLTSFINIRLTPWDNANLSTWFKYQTGRVWTTTYILSLVTYNNIEHKTLDKSQGKLTVWTLRMKFITYHIKSIALNSLLGHVLRQNQGIKQIKNTQ